MNLETENNFEEMEWSKQEIQKKGGRFNSETIHSAKFKDWFCHHNRDTCMHVPSWAVLCVCECRCPWRQEECWFPQAWIIDGWGYPAWVLWYMLLSSARVIWALQPQTISPAPICNFCIMISCVKKTITKNCLSYFLEGASWHWNFA